MNYYEFWGGVSEGIKSCDLAAGGSGEVGEKRWKELLGGLGINGEEYYVAEELRLMGRNIITMIKTKIIQNC